jgi:hypothetical protein
VESKQTSRRVIWRFSRLPNKQAFGLISGAMLLTLLVACLACPPTQANPGGQNMPTNSLCYAFTRGNDIWTVCDGKRVRIHIPDVS